ncbi:MAG: type VI secretion system tip protein VgrG [Silvanigrellaceae bacterium]|nr:type VI secretion system tip protein VgrG [Silvanigrellaceae bacterium]
MFGTNISKVAFLDKEINNFLIVDFEIHEKISDIFEIFVRCSLPSVFDTSYLDSLKEKFIAIKLEFLPDSDKDKNNIKIYTGIVCNINFVFNHLNSSYNNENNFIHGVDLIIKPVFWKLNYYNNYACYSKKNSKDILNSIFNNYKKIDVNFKYEFKIFHLSRLIIRENCVQFGESDYDFVLRLLDEDNLNFYFKHEDNSHTLIITDNICGVLDSQDPNVDEFDVNTGYSSQSSSIFSYVARTQVGINSVRVFDSDFRKFGNILQSQAGKKSTQSWSVIVPEIKKSVTTLDISSESITNKATNSFALEQTKQEVISGSAYSRSLLELGKKFKAKFNPISEKLKVPSQTLRLISLKSYFKNTSIQSLLVDFTATTAINNFMQSYSYSKNKQNNVTTAIVYGESGSSAITDQFMRIKIRFPWQPAKDDKELGQSSFVLARLAQPLAGNTYGFQFVPHPGHEVLISFENGDPELPIIIGSLYNNLNLTPYKLPENINKFCIKTSEDVSKNGETYSNSLEMDNNKGNEIVSLTSLQKLQFQAQDELTIKSRVRKTIVAEDDFLSIKDGKLTISVGSKGILIESQGDVLISSKQVKISASDELHIESAKKIEITGSSIKLSGSAGNLEIS